MKALTVAQGLQSAEALGRSDGENAAGWWEQDAVGGRASGDVLLTASTVLAGLEAGDPAVIDGLPSADLSGEWADGMTPRRLAEECLGIEDAGVSEQGDIVDQLCDAYEQGFSEACEAGVVAACKRVID